MRIKKYCLLSIIIAALLCSCDPNTEIERQTEQTATDLEQPAMEPEMQVTDNLEIVSPQDKGYDLPISDTDRFDAEEECKALMNLYADIYKAAEKGDIASVLLSDDIIFTIQDEIGKLGYPVTTTVPYSAMENYEIVDEFLKVCKNGISNSVIFYTVHSDGGFSRMKFRFDGVDMYMLNTRAMWNEENEPVISYTTYTRIKEWEYTEKGWFGYVLCVPEPPEVTEIIDGSCLIRVKPLTKEQQELSRKCVQRIAYQGNNLLCSNWDAENMSELDYNGIYEYFYYMKYDKRLDMEEHAEGIPKEEFERLIMEYLPVTREQIREWAVFDEEKQSYNWARLGCLTYDLSYFGTSVPEVVKVKENTDGTITLTVDAVCDMVICEDAVITHELTIKFNEDGGFQYLSNQILGDGIKNIPEYKYRVEKD